MKIVYSGLPRKRALSIILILVFSIILYNSELAHSDQHIPQQEQQPTQTEKIEYPSPKQTTDV